MAAYSPQTPKGLIFGAGRGDQRKPARRAQKWAFGVRTSSEQPEQLPQKPDKDKNKKATFAGK